MSTYIINTILCSASLYAIYYLLLEREKMYRFNRFYLLFSIVFSFTVSFITIKVAAPIMPVQETVVLADNSLPAIHTTPASVEVETTNYLPYLLPAFYFIVSAFLLYRFIRNLSRLLSKIKGFETISYAGAKLVLTNSNAIPFSFLNFIFVNKEKYERGTIEKEVLQHELTHVRQKHSLDVILIELFIALAWFNPLLFLFRRSILLNHEFLADESVVETFNDAKSYQLLLFEKANRKNNLMLTSSFNFLITKKRLTMMTRKTSQKVAIAKQIAIVPLIAALGFLFSTRVVAQDNSTIQKQKETVQNNVNAPQKVVDEYQAKLFQYGVTDKNGKHIPGSKELTAEQNNELGDLFVKMSKDQQIQQNVVFLPALKGSLPKTVPTKEQFESWKNPNVYGVWIDDKKVDNAVLNKYTNTDFSYGSATYVAKNARVGKKYFMQVNMMTKAYYDNYRSETLARQKADKNRYKMGFKLRRSVVSDIDNNNKSRDLYDQKVKLDKEQLALMQDQQKKLSDIKQDKQSILEQKIRLEKEQRALVLDQKKREVENQQLSRKLMDQKIQLDKEQRTEMNLQKVKMEKEMQSMTKEQKVMMKEQQAKMLLQKAKLEKEKELMMKDQKVMMKVQKAKLEKEKEAMIMEQKKMKDAQDVKMKLEKEKLDQDLKTKQEQK